MPKKRGDEQQNRKLQGKEMVVQQAPAEPSRAKKRLKALKGRGWNYL